MRDEFLLVLLDGRLPGSQFFCALAATSCRIVSASRSNEARSASAAEANLVSVSRNSSCSRKMSVLNSRACSRALEVS